MTTRAVERALAAYPEAAKKFETLSRYARAAAIRKLENSLRKLQRGTVEALPSGCQLHRPNFAWDIEFRPKRKKTWQKPWQAKASGC